MDEQCQAEMQDMSAQLFVDYKLSPDIVARCENEIKDKCKNIKKPDGSWMDCLMGLAEKMELSEQCYKAVSKPIFKIVTFLFD